MSTGYGEARRWFDGHVDIETDDCLVWPFSTYRGYPRLRGGWAHQFACEMGNGPRPPSTEVRHLCGERRCINKRHLVWAINLDVVDPRSLEDRDEKLCFGKRKKLSDADVADIRASTDSGAVLSRRYRVSQPHIGELRRGHRRPPTTV